MLEEVSFDSWGRVLSGHTSILNKSKEEEKEKHWVPLPYIGNIFNKVGGFLKNRLKWKVTFTPEPTGIYNVKYKNCDDSYRRIKRITHKGNVRRYGYNKSAMCVLKLLCVCFIRLCGALLDHNLEQSVHYICLWEFQCLNKRTIRTIYCVRHITGCYEQVTSRCSSCNIPYHSCVFIFSILVPTLGLSLFDFTIPIRHLMQMAFLRLLESLELFD